MPGQEGEKKMFLALSLADLFYIAIGIEKKGTAFYDVFGRTSEKKEVREIFQYLTGMERRHVQIFQEAFHLISKTQPQKYESEQPGYVQTLLDNSVFSDELADSELANRIESDIMAVELGIQSEKESILFYYEMRDQVEESTREAISRIIAEEKSHLRQLSELKKTLKNK